MTHPDGQTFTYTPDFLDRLTGITHSSAGSLASYTYDPKGRLDSLGGGITTNYDVNDAGQITSLTHDLAGSAHDNTFGYPTYNPASQIMQMNISNGLYAPVLFERNETYVANGLNQYTIIGGISHSYDNNGNLIADGDNVYAYDQENRLVRASSNGALKAELWYDPLGRLYKVQGATTTTFLYDGDELVAEYNGTSTTAPVANRYVHGLSVDDPIAWFEGASVTTTNKRHLRANHQGSIVAVADSGGNMKTLQQYDTWGRPQSTQTLRFGYTGQVWIPELELWHYKARMYSPELGRFLQTDPIGYADQMNLYAYVGNDPLNRVDPTGRFSNTLLKQALEEAAKMYGTEAAITQTDGPEPGPADAFAAGMAIGTTIVLGVDIVKAILSDDSSKKTDSEAGTPNEKKSESVQSSRKTHQPNKPNRKKQGREPSEKKRKKSNWKPRNPPKEPPRHTPSRKD